MGISVACFLFFSISRKILNASFFKSAYVFIIETVKCNTGSFFPLAQLCRISRVHNRVWKWIKRLQPILGADKTTDKIGWQVKRSVSRSQRRSMYRWYHKLVSVGEFQRTTRVIQYTGNFRRLDVIKLGSHAFCAYSHAIVVYNDKFNMLYNIIKMKRY